MKNKIKKILTATIVSAVSFTAIGCGTNNTKLAKNIDNSMAEFISSINNLDYVETGAKSSSTNDKVGKIVETSAPMFESNKTNTSQKLLANSNEKFLNESATNSYLENTITKPQERSDNFKLFVLSESPFITLTSNDNDANLNLNVKFSTNKIETTSTEIESKINTLILKRSILMIYVNEIYNNNVNLTEENKIAINAYVNVIKENTSYLKGNRGMVKNQLKLASNLVSSEQNENLVNYYIIKSGEALETRVNKLNSTIEAIDSIINIIENNLTNNSSYYKTNLSNTYNNILSNLSTNKSNPSELTKDSSNVDVAKSIADSLNFTNLNNTSINTQTNLNNINQPNKLPSTNNNTINEIVPHQTTNSTNQSQNITSQNTNNSLNNTVNQQNELNENRNNKNIQNNLNNKTIKRRHNRRSRNMSNLNNTNQNTNNNDATNTNLLGNNNIQSNMPNKDLNYRNNRIRINNFPTSNSNNSQNNLRPSQNNNDMFKENTINQTNTNNIEIKEEHDNKNNTGENKLMTDNEQKIMRAKRTPEQTKTEEYTSAKVSNLDMETNRATHVPYRTQNKF